MIAVDASGEGAAARDRTESGGSCQDLFSWLYTEVEAPRGEEKELSKLQHHHLVACGLPPLLLSSVEVEPDGDSSNYTSFRSSAPTSPS